MAGLQSGRSSDVVMREHKAAYKRSIRLDQSAALVVARAFDIRSKLLVQLAHERLVLRLQVVVGPSDATGSHIGYDLERSDEFACARVAC